MTTQIIRLNMIPGGVMPVVYASQYDNQTNALQFELYNGDEPFTVPSGAAVLINGTKPPVDGQLTGFSYSAASISGNRVVCNVTQQMTAVPGNVLCELRVRTATQIIGSVNFVLMVERSALNDDTVLSETQIPLIEQAIDIAANLADYIDTAVQSAETATDAAETATAAAQRSEVINTNVEGIYGQLTAATAAANAAAQAANAAADTLEDLSATATTLAAGSSATASYNPSTGVMSFGIPKGDKGDSGITATASSFFTLYVDENGDLYAEYNDNDNPPPFWYDEETGILYYYTNGKIEAVNGNPINIMTAGEQEPLAMTVDIAPVQSGSGDPSPDNVRPISGWTGAKVTRCGVNLLTSQYVKKSGNEYRVGANSSNEFPFFLKAGNYTFSNKGTAAHCYWRQQGTDLNNVIHNATVRYGTFTVPEDDYYRFWFYSLDADASFTELQLELGSTATAYEPYSGQTYDITFPSEAGTVYGGTLDVTTGVLTVNYKKYTVTEDQTFTNRIAGQNRVYFLLPDMLSGSYFDDSMVLCDTLPKRMPQSTGTTEPSIAIYGDYIYLQGLTFLDGVTNLDTFKTWLQSNPIGFTYKLATPQTYQLTPQQIELLEGANTISVNDGCTINLTYIGEV